MNKTKIRFLTILALFCALALALSFATGFLLSGKKALALDYRPTEIFSAGTGGSVDASEGEGDKFVRFTLSDDGSVYFRRDLALKWYAPVAPAEGEGGAEAQAEGASYEEKFFSMTFAFPTFGFTRFTIDFESVEENISKEGTATNSLVFFYEEDKLSAAVRDASSQPAKDLKEEDDGWFQDAEKTELSVQAGEDIVLTFTDEGVGFGEYAVLVNGTQIGVFTNIGGYFMEYLSSASSTPRDPITFTANALSEGNSNQTLLMKELNGQSFKLNDDGRVVDDADPVLVVNEAIYAYTLGRKWSLTYEAVDVCDSSVTVTRMYAMVNAAGEDGLYPKPVSSEYSTLTTSTVFMPTSDTQEEEQYVSIYFLLDDGANLSDLTSEEKEAKRIYLSWYAADGQTKTLGSAKVYECPQCGYRLNKEAYDKLEDGWVCPDPDKKDGHTEVKKSDLVETAVDDFTYIIVNRGDVAGGSENGEKSGPKYVGIEADAEELKNVSSDEAKELAEKYQQAVDDVAYEVVDGVKKLKLSAGDGSYFYLPSLRGLIASENADYRNLRFSVYYKKQGLETGSSASSATSLRYNALRFEIDEEGKYVFKVLAADAAGNAMKYYVDGRLTAVSASNIWDIEEIPTFSFEVTYTGATIEDPGTQSNGYRESTYTISSFDIVGLEGYKTTYRLFYLDASKLTAGQSASDLVSDVKGNFASYANCLREIKTFDDSVSEDDEDRWDRTDNKYHWDPDSALSFIPQEAGNYIVELEVTEENRLPGSKAVAYQVIEVQNPLDPIPNATAWLESNVVSVVFFTISAVLLVVIIVLFVVKPSEKNIEEVDVSALRGKKNGKKSGKD